MTLLQIGCQFPLPFSFYMRHGFCSESEDVEGNRVKRTPHQLTYSFVFSYVWLSRFLWIILYKMKLSEFNGNKCATNVMLTLCFFWEFLLWCDEMRWQVNKTMFRDNCLLKTGRIWSFQTNKDKCVVVSGDNSFQFP